MRPLGLTMSNFSYEKELTIVASVTTPAYLERRERKGE